MQNVEGFHASMTNSLLSRPLTIAVLLFACLASIANPRNTTAQDSTHQSVGQLAVNTVLKQVALDPAVHAPKTGKRIPANGAWSIAKEPPSSCPQESRCETVLYTVPEADVTCQWTVALDSNNEGTILDQNADASRYMVHVLRQDQVRALVLSRKEPEYPPAAILAHIDGEILLRVTVSASGKSEKVDVVSTSNPMFGPTAIDAANQWTFKPLLIGNQPVRFQTALKFTFTTHGPGSADVTSTP
jgi:TonB family protein